MIVSSDTIDGQNCHLRIMIRDHPDGKPHTVGTRPCGQRELKWRASSFQTCHELFGHRFRD